MAGGHQRGHPTSEGFPMKPLALAMGSIIVFGGFLVMTRGVPILFSRLLVLRRSLGGHSLFSHERVGHAMPRFPPRHARSLGLHAPGEL
jgi:hypothetical protein